MQPKRPGERVGDAVEVGVDEAWRIDGGLHEA
jgi:hypothetical protein